MMKNGVYVTDPHRYESYLAELDLPLDHKAAQAVSRIMMHRRGDVKLCEDDVDRVVRILGSVWFERDQNDGAKVEPENPVFCVLQVNYWCKPE